MVLESRNLKFPLRRDAKIYGRSEKEVVADKQQFNTARTKLPTLVIQDGMGKV